MEKQNEEKDYNYNEAAEYILDNISDELSEKLSHQDIITLLEIEDKYIEEREQENLKKKPFVSFDLVTIDQDDINYYVMTNAIKFNIIIDKEETEEIMYAELGYMEQEGMTEDSTNLN